MAEKVYIEREAIKSKKVYSEERHEYVVPVAEIDWMVSADVAPVVRCKDCKCAQTNNFGVSSNIVLCCLETSKSVRQMDDFCSYGERKENDNAEIH